MPALIVIPARGGSKGIPRKNVRLLAGRPLLSYAIEAALAARCRSAVVVSTEDAEIAELAEACGADVLWRPPELSHDSVPLDPVVLDAAARAAGAADVVVTLQPTSPFVTGDDIDESCDILLGSNANVVFGVTDDTHLTWSIEGDTFVPQHPARVNRQLQPRRLRETGGVVCTRLSTLLTHKTRFVPPYAVLEFDAARAIDIDDRIDWAFAEATLALRSVAIVTRGAMRVGRQLTLASGLTKHEIRFVLAANDDSGRQTATRANFPVQTVENLTADVVAPHGDDVVILDLDDGSTDLARGLKRASCTVVALVAEPQGTADAELAAPSPDATKEEVLRLLPQLTIAIESSLRRPHANRPRR